MHQVTGSSSVAVLKGEIHNVLALMRANARYSAVWRFTRESPDNKENPLVAGLKSLHETLVNVRDIADVDTVDWLRPFLDIIVTPETSGPITAGALGSISKFLLYEFVRTKDAIRAAEGANRIAFIVCRCRFEATDTDSDEVVSMKIVQVLVDLLRCSAGALLTDHSVYEICLACLGICSQSRLSELLRRAAEHCLTQVILTVFSRLTCDAPVEVSNEDDAPAAEEKDKLPATAAVWDERPESASAFMSEADEVACQDALDKREIWPKTIVSKPPHGVSCMQKILILLCQLTDPSKKDERSRVLGLSLLNVVLETCGSSLSNHPSLVNVMQNTLCKFLLQNSRTTSLSILSLVLRAVFNMFNSVGVHLKVQLEVFFNSMHLALAENTSSPPLIREMALESLVEFCREPQLIIDLYVNYDCAVQSTNLFERLVKFLFKMSEPGNSLNSFHLQAFEGILAILGALCKEIDRQHAQKDLAEDGEIPSSRDASDAIRDSRIRKKSLQVAAEAFNKNPKESIRNLQSYGFAQAPEATPAEVAAFLREAPGLNKTVVGEYLGDHNAFNVAVLSAYAATFSFHNLSLDAALRLFLSGFRLCGEAQKIDRVMEAFSKTMHEHSPGPLKKWDGAFTLAFSLIMLNTDIHSPNVKNKMTKEQFIKNNKGMNAGEDFPREYLEELFDNISLNEIKLRDDLSQSLGDLSLDDRNWTDLLQGNGDELFNRPASAGIYIRDIFAMMADGLISSIAQVFEATSNKRVLEKSLEGFEMFAKVCKSVDMGDAINRMMAALYASMLKFTTHDNGDGQPAGKKVFVSFTKLRIAGMTWFRIVRDIRFISMVTTAWQYIIDYVVVLKRLDALPLSIIDHVEFLDCRGKPLNSIATISTAPASVTQSWNLFSYFWSSGSTSSPVETSPPAASTTPASDKESARTFGTQLQLPEIFRMLRSAHEACVEAAFLSLLSAVENQLAVFQPGARDASHDTCLFLTEILGYVAVTNLQKLGNLQRYFSFLNSLIAVAPRPSRLLECAVTDLMRVAVQSCGERAGVPASPLVAAALDLIQGLPSDVMLLLSDVISVGVGKMMGSFTCALNRRNWESLFSILNSLISDGRSMLHCWDGIEHIVRESPPGSINSVNLDLCLMTLRLLLDQGRHVGPTAQSSSLSNSTDSSDSLTGSVTRSMVLDLLHSLYCRLHDWRFISPEQNAGLTESAFSDLWVQTWLLVLHSFSRLLDDHRHHDLSSQGFGLLEKALLQPEHCIARPLHWLQCFREVVFPVVNAKFESRSPRSSDNFRMRLFVLVTSAFATHARSMATVSDFQAVWLQLLALICDWANKIKELGDVASHSSALESLSRLFDVIKEPDFPINSQPGSEFSALSESVLASFAPNLHMLFSPQVKDHEVVGEKGDSTGTIDEDNSPAQGSTITADAILAAATTSSNLDNHDSVAENNA